MARHTLITIVCDVPGCNKKFDSKDITHDLILHRRDRDKKESDKIHMDLCINHANQIKTILAVKK